eukprot:Rmarinus@m.2365
MDSPFLKPEVIKAVYETVSRQEGTKFTPEALKLSSLMLKIFVQETLQRSIQQARMDAIVSSSKDKSHSKKSRGFGDSASDNSGEGNDDDNDNQSEDDALTGDEQGSAPQMEITVEHIQKVLPQLLLDLA